MKNDISRIDKDALGGAKLQRRHFLSRASLLTGAVSIPGLAGLPETALAKPVVDSGSPGLYAPMPGVAKLNANENPYGPSEAAKLAASEAVNAGAYYVDKSVKKLTDMIAERHGINNEQILLSPGSSAALSWAAMAMAGSGKILGPDLFFDYTAKACERIGGEPILRAPKTKDLSIDLDTLYSMIDDDVAMVQITNPNNPTGTLLDPKKLTEFCIKASKKSLVLVDEAYIELTDLTEANSMMELLKQGHNIIVARTFSKIYGLAGMRVGYVMGSEENIALIRRFGMESFTLNQAGIAAAVASYNDFRFLDSCRAKITEAREMVLAGLKQNGLQACPSQTNFLFVDLKNRNAEVFRRTMEEKNVLIRGIYRDYTHWSRVSMGYLPDVKKYLNALPWALEKTPIISV